MIMNKKNQSSFSSKYSLFPKSRKGAEKTISVYWFAILVIVTGAVIYMVSLVYGEPYDIRNAEADIFANKIADCLSEGGYMNEGVLTEPFKQNFLDNCRLNIDASDFPESNGEYYFEVSVYDFETGSSLNYNVKGGNSNLKLGCEQKGKTQPVCTEKQFYSLDKNQKSYTVKILAIVNKVSKNSR
ncbi:MAG: hypothetical protein WD876_01895 [Candidatus Pacearchaeota archaeon]